MLLYLVVQEQLLEREQTILELERKMDEKDRELLAIKRDNEAVGKFGCGFLPLFSSVEFIVNWLLLNFM